LQPIFLKIYNPWAKVEDKTEGSGSAEKTELKCPISGFQSNQAEPAACPGGAPDKKTD